METISRALVVLGTLAIVGAVVAVAHFVGWAGPSYAAGVLSGAAFFFCWYKLRYGRWP